jgi:S1-C subfamily serine protease
VLCVLVALGLVAASPWPAQAGAPSETIAEVVAKVKAAVVEIVVVQPKDDGEKPDQQTAEAVDGSARRATAIRSGFVIDPSGYIASDTTPRSSEWQGKPTWRC